jgi:hypothetical protein
MSNREDPSRRDILVTAAAALAAGGTPPGARAAATNDSAGSLAARRKEARHLRVRLAEYYSSGPLRHHPTNRDEDELQDSAGRRNYIGNYSKGLQHNQWGEVLFESYQTLLDALRSGDPDLFERILLGALASNERRGNRLRPYAVLRAPQEKQFYRPHFERGVLSAGSKQMRLINPQSGLAFDLEGADSHELVVPPCPGFRSKEIIGEIAENYWMAIARDVPFLHYPKSKLIDGAVRNLSEYTEFRGPKEDDRVTPGTVFRGSAAGDLIGPYVSQFLLRPIPFGAYRLSQQVVYGFKPEMDKGERDFLITPDDWLSRQRGDDPQLNPTPVDQPKYIHRGRDLASFVHIDELFQAYLNAALILGAPPERNGLGAYHGEGNPYDGYVHDPQTGRPAGRVSTQLGFGTLGEPSIKSMVAEVATRALKAVWYQKWFVHRRLRPEAFAGRIHFHQAKQRIYPFDPDEFKRLDPVLDAVRKHNQRKGGDGLFLPMAFPEGCPLHPAYGAGHATVAGACTTVLKAMYQDLSFQDLGASIYVATEDGTDLKDLKAENHGGYRYGDLAPKLTVAGELNKLASNISLGRNFAGVHWRSDHAESLRLGEKVAVEFLRETVSTYNENVYFDFKGFDGTRIVLSKHATLPKGG